MGACIRLFPSQCIRAPARIPIRLLSIHATQCITLLQAFPDWARNLNLEAARTKRIDAPEARRYRSRIKPTWQRQRQRQSRRAGRPCATQSGGLCSKSLIPLSDCPFVLNRLPVFLGNLPVSGRKTRKSGAQASAATLVIGLSRLQPLDGGAAPQPVSTCGFPSLTRAIRKVRAQPHHAKAIKRYCPMVRTTLASGRVLFEDSLSWCVTISSYLGVVVSGCRGTMWTTL